MMSFVMGNLEDFALTLEIFVLRARILSLGFFLDPVHPVRGRELSVLELEGDMGRQWLVLVSLREARFFLEYE